MPTLAPPAEFIAESTAAQREAETNWNNNLAALRTNQSAVAEVLESPELSTCWTYARDGSLTAMTADGKWRGGCSVPLLAGQSILKSLENTPTGSCLLAPAHAGLVRAARERMGACPVLYVVQPDLQIARMILSCHDFSEQIVRHRFWLVCDEAWPEQFRQLLEEHPGLATPTRFIRTRWTSDDLINPIITAAQDLFSAVLSRRTALLSSRQSKAVHSPDIRQILVVGGSDFRLWDNATLVLHEQLAARSKSDGLTIHRFDTDDALCGSPLALLEATASCGCIVSANLCRADCNQLVSPEIPWITWITQPAMPTFESAGPRDSLVLADVNWCYLTQRAGWPDHRVQVCGWPRRAVRHSQLGVKPELALICNTHPTEIPATVSGYSSHKLLWELIEEELHADPLAVEKIEDYLTDRAGQLNIGVDTLDRQSFIDGLILPAYQQGLARLLIAAELPIALWGNGWKDQPEFAAQSRGDISNHQELEAAITTSAGLIYSHPAKSAHPMEAIGKPIVHRSGRDRQQLNRTARRVLAGSQNAATAVGTDRLGQIIRDLIRATGSVEFRKAG